MTDFPTVSRTGALFTREGAATPCISASAAARLGSAEGLDPTAPPPGSAEPMLSVAVVYSSIVLTVSFFFVILSFYCSLYSHAHVSMGFRCITRRFSGTYANCKLPISWNPGTSLSQETCTARTSVLPVDTGPVPSPAKCFRYS